MIQLNYSTNLSNSRCYYNVGWGWTEIGGCANISIELPTNIGQVNLSMREKNATAQYTDTVEVSVNNAFSSSQAILISFTVVLLLAVAFFLVYVMSALDPSHTAIKLGLLLLAFLVVYGALFLAQIIAEQYIHNPAIYTSINAFRFGWSFIMLIVWLYFIITFIFTALSYMSSRR